MMRFDLVTHEPDALFSAIAKQQRDQAVLEANDAERRQTTKRCDSRSMAAAGTKPQGRAVDDHDTRENAKTAGVKAERSRRYDNNECSVFGKQGHKQQDCPQRQQGKAGKRRPWPYPRPDSYTAAAVFERSSLAFPEEDNRDGPCDCHPSS